MDNITEGILDFKTLERTIFRYMCQIACQMVQLYLQTWDMMLMARRDTKEYRCVGRRRATVKTVMGEVAYERTYYKKKSGGYVFLLDEAMGLGGNYGRISENLGEQIVGECVDKSFRRAAKSISNQTGQEIKAMRVWNVLQRYGKRIKGQVQRLKELEENGITGQLGNIACPVLFTEYDDVWINRQHERRGKAGTGEKQGRKRLGMRPMHVGIAYTGAKKVGEGRYEAVNKTAYASVGEATEFAEDFEALLQHRYDMDAVAQRIANGDGENWIRKAAADADAILQLDPYHKNQAILQGVKDKEGRKRIHDALREKDVGEAIDTISALLTGASEETECKKLVDLLTYFDNNRDSLLPWQERGISIPAPPEGTEYRNMGLQESNNCALITSRMKHRKGSWGTEGANHMAKVLCLSGTIGLGLMLRPLPGVQAGNPPKEVLSAAKSPMHDGKGDWGTWLLGALPIEESFLTHGREAIRDLVRQRRISELKFI